MDLRERLLQQFIVRPGEAAGLAARDPGWTGGTEFPDLAADERQQRAIDARRLGSAELSEAQELLWASDQYALLVVLQAMDAAGKDSVIKHVMHGRQPAGRAGGLVQEAVVGGARPRLPVADLARAAGARAHRHLQPLALRGGRRAEGASRSGSSRSGSRPASGTRRSGRTRYEDINGFERHLDRSGTKVVKFFLHVSRAAQKQRFLARLDQPGKEWKFNAADVAERHRFDEYRDAFEDALTATSTPGRRGTWSPPTTGGSRRRSSRRCSSTPSSGSTCAGPRSRPRRTPRTSRRARSSRPSALEHEVRRHRAPDVEHLVVRRRAAAQPLAALDHDRQQRREADAGEPLAAAQHSVVSSPFCSPGSSVASAIMNAATSEIASALRIGGREPAARVAAVGQRVEDRAEAHDGERHRQRDARLVRPSARPARSPAAGTRPTNSTAA